MKKLVILLKLRFYVKSILMSWKTTKMGILPIQDALKSILIDLKVISGQNFMKIKIQSEPKIVSK